MEELESAMDALLTQEPELTFRDVLAELIKKGEIDYGDASDSYVHTWLYGRYQRAKERALRGKVNSHI